MIIGTICVHGVRALPVSVKPIPRGIIGAKVQFEYADPMWDGLSKTVVFRAGDVTKDVLNAGEVVDIPPEVVEEIDEILKVGVYGEGIPTLWADLGRIRDATDPSGDESTDPSLPVWEQLLLMVGDLKGLNTTAKESLVAAVNEVLKKGGGTADPEEIREIVDEYLAENPPKVDLKGVVKSVNGETPDENGNVEIAIPDSGGNADQIGLVEYHASNNLYDPENLVGTHTINGSSVSGLSNWIPVKAKTKYVINKTYTQYYLFDAEKNYLSSATHIYAPVVITAPQDGFLLIKTNGDTETVVVEGTDLGNHYEDYYALRESLTRRVSKMNNNTWIGKKWLAIGDSLTDPGVASEGYPHLVSKALGLTLTNVGASGKDMKYFVDLIPDFADDFDLVTVLLGTNNQGYNCGIGSLNDGVDYTTNESFYAQAQKVAEVLMEKYPTAVIAFLTPIRRTGVGSQNNNDEGYMINTLGLTTEPYAEAVKEVADYYGLPCLDLYHNGINPKSEWMRQLYFSNSSGGSDGTHPNNEGHAKYTAPVIKAFLESLAPFGERIVVEPDIPEPDEPVTTYTVTNTLTNATNSNSAARVNKGASYSATIRANSGYELGSVTVTMGGTDISASAVSGGVITIASVTGNIVITATATKVEVDSGEPVLVHSYLSTPVDGILEDQTGTFDLAQQPAPMSDWYTALTSADAVLGVSSGNSVSFKFKNVTRQTIYFSRTCEFNSGGMSASHATTDGRSIVGRIIVDCACVPEGVTGVFGDAIPKIEYYSANRELVTNYASTPFKKGETHTITVTYDSSNNGLRMYVDGNLEVDIVMDTALNFDGTAVKYYECPYEVFEIYKGIITDVS